MDGYNLTDDLQSSMEALLKEKGNSGLPSIYAMPLYTAYDTNRCGKAHYNYISDLFLREDNWNGDKAVALADTIGQMSEEIFEHYKALVDLLKIVINQVIISTAADSQELMKYGYAALMGYNLGVLQHEKYLEFGMAIWKTTVECGEHRSGGIEEKFRTQYIQIGK